MKSIAIDPARLYPGNQLFLDYVAHRSQLLDLFQVRPSDWREAARRRSAQEIHRADLADVLIAYNRSIHAPPVALQAIERLRSPGALCVISGQQAGLLGGPSYTAYKILTTIRLARHLSGELGVPVIPIFWLASEDHDLTEINHVRWLSTDGSFQAVAFDDKAPQRAIESLSITDEIRRVASEAEDALSLPANIRDLLQPAESDDYGRWHARIWSRLFADDGLVVVEPRILRPLSGPFFERALVQQDRIRAGLETSSARLVALGYEPSLDPKIAGLPFRIHAAGTRTRLDTFAYDPSVAYSADAALRPVLADTLCPTIASVLGPGEIAYHAQLRPVYEALDVSQPVYIARHGYTVISTEDADLLDRLDVPLEAAFDPTFDPQPKIDAQVPEEISSAFDRARDDVRTALTPLKPLAQDADPGLEARWRQLADRADNEVTQLEGRVVRAQLARAGLSVRRLRAILESLRPAGQPQERALSFVHLLARFGVEWIHQLPGADHPDRFSHDVVILHERT